VKKDELDTALGYFENDAPRMRYHFFRQCSLFVGSGVRGDPSGTSACICLAWSSLPSEPWWTVTWRRARSGVPNSAGLPSLLRRVPVGRPCSWRRTPPLPWCQARR
jgi:hypothetical protein